MTLKFLYLWRNPRTNSTWIPKDNRLLPNCITSKLWVLVFRLTYPYLSGTTQRSRVKSWSKHLLSILNNSDLLFLFSLSVSSFFPKFMLFSHWTDLFIFCGLSNPYQSFKIQGKCCPWQSFLVFLANNQPSSCTLDSTLLGNILVTW